LWPHLRLLIDYACEYGINVNLTTKNIAWLKSENRQGLGAIAVSLNNRRDLDRFSALDLIELRREARYPEITVQFASVL
jgi:hypothetical protein